MDANIVKKCTAALNYFVHHNEQDALFGDENLKDVLFTLFDVVFRCHEDIVGSLYHATELYKTLNSARTGEAFDIGVTNNIINALEAEVQRYCPSLNETQARGGKFDWHSKLEHTGDGFSGELKTVMVRWSADGKSLVVSPEGYNSLKSGKSISLLVFFLFLFLETHFFLEFFLSVFNLTWQFELLFIRYHHHGHHVVD